MITPSTEFRLIFDALRAIPRAHASALVVSSDKPGYYRLDIPFSPKFNKRFPVAWVKISKSYVSFHFMPVYYAPQLQKSLSPALKARMQGKSCFNFKIVDEALFKELQQLTARGFELSRREHIV
jgi:hypothetical protein